ncbi:aminotransferase class I/II-fold pyridoxal phosphate-dependent enzyme [Spongiibacter marinus]|uniref:aminotransferase class I/II-fold pyridoxal phosphate-dependent enzyme n=1 Tax=Spongiibacter marinus TaxID=354246 RepID=UPI003C5DF0BD
MSERIAPPRHGGDPNELHYPEGMPRPLLNLATGINPWPWPVPALPSHCFTELPYENPELQASAAAYYQVDVAQLLLCGGSQPVIQLLPQLYPQGNVLLPAVAYEEHAYRWQLGGHHCRFFSDYSSEAVAAQIREQDIQYLVLINPNNPDGQQLPVTVVAQWLALLPPDGCLVIDQAYVDCVPAYQANALLADKRVVLLRSVGKFFGLPGLRLGAVLSHPETIIRLREQLGPWSVNHAAQLIGQQLFADREWQETMRQQLPLAAHQQAQQLLRCFGRDVEHCAVTPLFTTLKMPLGQAEKWAMQALKQGLLCRVYRCGEYGYMRWGLAANADLLAERLALIEAAPCG